MDELASKIVTDLSAADAWWQREDPSRTIRFDRFAFPGCASKLGSSISAFSGWRAPHRPTRVIRGSWPCPGADRSRVIGLPEERRLLRRTVSVGPDRVRHDSGASQTTPSVEAWAASRSSGCARSAARTSALEISTPRSSPTSCIHGMGFVRPDAAARTNARSPTEGTSATASSTSCTRRRRWRPPSLRSGYDVNREDYYDNEIGSYNRSQFDDLRDSRYLTHLPQQRLALGVRVPGKARGMIRMTFPASFNCRGACALELDRGVVVTLIATPSRGSPLPPLVGCMQGKRACYVTLGRDWSAVATFDRAP